VRSSLREGESAVLGRWLAATGWPGKPPKASGLAAPAPGHWHRLAAYGLEKDLLYCVTPDVANVLPRYINGDLLASE
jgi:hypothetical protein